MSQLKNNKKVYKHTNANLGTLYEVSEILSDKNKQTYELVTRAFVDNQSVALVQATGTRKTSIAVQWLIDNLKEGEKAIFLVPTASIAQQHIKLFKRLGLDDKLKQIKFVLYSSLGAEIDSNIESVQGVKYIVADEFHRLGAPTWGEGYFGLLLLNPEAKVLGLSATPVRYLDGERDMAESLFDVTVHGTNIAEAIEEGILCAPNYVRGVLSYSAELEELAKLKKRVKDKDAQKEIEKAEKDIKNQIQHAQGLEDLFGTYMTAKNGKYIVFCSSLDHLEEIKQKIIHGMFKNVNSKVSIYDVSYKKSTKDVNATIEEFENNENDHLKIMLAVEMLNEGVHVGGVDGAIMMRRTISPRIFLQQLGRVLNVGQGKNPLVIDVVENYESIQSFASYFTPSEGGAMMDDGDIILPFEIKGEAVAIDRLIGNLKKFIYTSFGNDYYIDLAKKTYEKQGNWRGLHLIDKSLTAWFWLMRREYAQNPNIPRLTDVFDQLAKIDPNWTAELSRSGQDAQEKRIAQIQEYADAHGGSLDGVTAHPDKALARWFCARKNDYQENPNDPQWDWVFDQLSKIDADWHVDVKKESNKKRLQKAMEYYEKNKSWEGISEDKGLVQWLSIKRKLHQQNPSNPEQKWIFDELAKIDPNWHMSRAERRQEEKKAHIEEAKEFFIANGNSWHGIFSKNKNLCTWLNTQKSLYKKDPHSPENEWVFDQLAKIDPNWNEDRANGNVNQAKMMLEKVKAFYQKNGWVGVKKSDIYSWYSERKQEYRKNPNNPEKKWIFDELAKIDPNWSESRSNNSKKLIQNKIAMLREYYLANNESWKNLMQFDVNLNAWLINRKEEYRKNPSDADKQWIFDELAKIDPNWHLDRAHGNDTYQQSMLEEAKDYYKKNKSWKGLKKGEELYNWLHNRKKEYKADPNRADRQDIFNQLSALDPNWHLDSYPGNDNYQKDMLENAKTFYEGNGNSWESISQKNTRLYKWLSARRRDYKSDPNNEEKQWIFDALSEIDPLWYVDKNTPIIDGVEGEESEIK